MTAPPLRVVFLWHFHQPWYPTFDGVPPALPWVRLHALKDYFDLPALLSEEPRIHHTANLVPALLDQIDLLARGGSDAFLDVARTPATEWDSAAVRFARQNFFAVHPRILERFPRLADLQPARRGRRCALPLRPHGPRRPVPSRVVGTGPPEGSSRRPPAQARTRLHRDGEERASGPSGGVPRGRDPRVEARLRVGSRRSRDEPLPPPDPAAPPGLERGARRASRPARSGASLLALRRRAVAARARPRDVRKALRLPPARHVAARGGALGGHARAARRGRRRVDGVGRGRPPAVAAGRPARLRRGRPRAHGVPPVAPRGRPVARHLLPRPHPLGPDRLLVRDVESRRRRRRLRRPPAFDPRGRARGRARRPRDPRRRERVGVVSRQRRAVPARARGGARRAAGLRGRDAHRGAPTPHGPAREASNAWSRARGSTGTSPRGSERLRRTRRGASSMPRARLSGERSRPRPWFPPPRS